MVLMISWWRQEIPQVRGFGANIYRGFSEHFNCWSHGFLVGMKKPVKTTSSPEQRCSSGCNPGGRKTKKKIIKSADCMENTKIIPVEWRWWGNDPWALWSFLNLTPEKFTSVQTPIVSARRGAGQSHSKPEDFRSWTPWQSLLPDVIRSVLSKQLWNSGLMMFNTGTNNH